MKTKRTPLYSYLFACEQHAEEFKRKYPCEYLTFTRYGSEKLWCCARFGCEQMTNRAALVDWKPNTRTNR